MRTNQEIHDMKKDCAKAIGEVTDGSEDVYKGWIEALNWVTMTNEQPEPVLATRHNDNEVIDVSLTEDIAFEEGFKQGQLRPHPELKPRSGLYPQAEDDAFEKGMNQAVELYIKELKSGIEETLATERDTYDCGNEEDKNIQGWIEALEYVLREIDMAKTPPTKEAPEPVKSYPEYTSIISQLTESLSCDADEIEDTVNVLNMTEYWVENKMLDLCEDNDVMRKVLWSDFKEFIQKYKPQNLSVEELYVTDKSEEDR